MKHTWLAVGIALMALSGCGTTAAPEPTPPAATSTSPEPAVSSPASPGQQSRFSSPELGVSFSYPSDWQLTQATPFDAQGNASVTVMNPDRSSGLTLQVSSPEATAGTAPGPFTNATKADLDMAEQSYAPEAKILASKLALLGGLRLAQIEYISSPPAIVSEPRRHAIYFASGFGAGGSQVMFSVDAVRSAWKAQEPTLRAILDSMRFSQPQGRDS